MLRALLAAGAAVIVVVAAADRLLAAVAVRQVGRRIKLASHASAVPKVRFVRGPFLPQLLAGVYRDIDVTIGAFSAGGIDFSGMTARLSEVRVPLRRVLTGGVLASQITATATIPFSVLGGRLPPGLTLRQQGDDMRVSGTVLRVPVFGTLGIRADREKISVTPKVIGVPALVGFAIGLPALPPEVKITSVRVTGGGLDLTVRGTAVRLGGQR